MGNQANRHGRSSRHVGIGNGIICGTVGSSSTYWGPDHAAVGIARLMEVALKLIHELAPFLSQTDLGLLGLTALGSEGDPIENRPHHDRQNCTHDDEFEQREALLRRK